LHAPMFVWPALTPGASAFEQKHPAPNSKPAISKPWLMHMSIQALGLFCASQVQVGATIRADGFSIAHVNNLQSAGGSRRAGSIGRSAEAVKAPRQIARRREGSMRDFGVRRV